MPRLQYTGTGGGSWRTKASDDYKYKYVTARADARIVDVDDATAKKLLNSGVFEPASETSSESDPSDSMPSRETPDSDALDDFDAIDGVGAAMEENLYDAGYTTFNDVATASDDELLAIDGVGGAALDALRDHIGNNETGDSAFDVGG